MCYECLRKSFLHTPNKSLMSRCKQGRGHLSSFSTTIDEENILSIFLPLIQPQKIRRLSNTIFD